MTQTTAAILLHEADNVLIAREDMQATDPIPRGHKLARRPAGAYASEQGFLSRPFFVAPWVGNLRGCSLSALTWQQQGAHPVGRLPGERRHDVAVDVHRRAHLTVAE